MKGIIDIHCHILPGVDDGAAALTETIKMLELEYSEGVRTIVATPHYRRHIFECSMEKIEQQYREVKEAARGIGEGMDVYLGCEYYANMEMVEKLKHKLRPTMADSTYVLTEFSEGTEFAFIRERIYELLTNGYKPIIAHIERYLCLTQKQERVDELIKLGAYMQVNADSITGGEGWKVKRFCSQLMKDDQLHFVGTDGHNMNRRVPHMAACTAFIAQKMGAEYARKVLIENPAQIITGKYQSNL